MESGADGSDDRGPQIGIGVAPDSSPGAGTRGRHDAAADLEKSLTRSAHPARPTWEGQYVLGDIVLVTATMVIAAGFAAAGSRSATGARARSARRGSGVR